jgi:transmembrane protein DUF3566
VDDRVSDSDITISDIESIKATAAEPVLADDSADASYSWSSSSWSSPSWNSASSWDPASTVADSPAAPSGSPASTGHVPFPADEVGKPKASTVGADNGAAVDPAPGATQPPRSFFEPAKSSGSDVTAADRIGAAATALNNKLDLNGKLDRGRQVWQSLTGPNNWLSGKGTAESAGQESSPASPAAASASPFTSTRQAPPASAPAPSVPSGGSGYPSSGFGSSSWDTPTSRVGQSGSASNAGNSASGHSDPSSRSASYGGPAADATLTAGAVGAAAGAAAGRAAAVPGGAGYSSGAGQSTRTGTGPSAATPRSGTNRKGSRPAATVKGSKRKDQRRQAQLTLARVEPWSVMKFSFVVSVVAFIVLFVAVALLYMVLSSLGVFESLQHTISNLTSAKNQAGTNVSSWFSASRVLGYTGMLGALNIVLITAMSTIGAVIYNLIAHTIGGIEVTLRETD